MFTRLFSLLTTDRFIPNYSNVLDRENDIIKCQILVEIIIIEDNIFHLLWRICVISFITIIYRFQTKWLPRRWRTRSPLVCIYISLTGKYLIIIIIIIKCMKSACFQFYIRSILNRMDFPLLWKSCKRFVEKLLIMGFELTLINFPRKFHFRPSIVQVYIGTILYLRHVIYCQPVCNCF